jgi:rhodanese-related sulfurtransferase
MDTIDRHGLQELLATDQPVRLVMMLGPHRFAQAHIPGSETFADLDQALDDLEPGESIVVYCSGPACQASAWAQRILTTRGYRDVRRYVGGLEEWHAAGLPLATATTDEPAAA